MDTYVRIYLDTIILSIYMYVCSTTLECIAGSVMVSRYPTGKLKENSERERVRGALTAVASTRRHGVFS